MNNAEWMNRKGMSFNKLCSEVEGNYALIKYENKNDSHRIVGKIRLSEIRGGYAIGKWLDMEYEEPTLTNKEIDYLEAVIRPFREKVKTIHKSIPQGRSEPYLTFYNGCFTVGSVPAESQFAGFELNREYTLDELGL